MVNLERLCIACANKLLFFGRRCEYTYYICRGCKSIQLFPLPTQQELESLYSNSNYASEAYDNGDPVIKRMACKPYYDHLINILRAYNVKGLVIDYGCGWGGLTETLLTNGFSALGFELAKSEVEDCQRRGLPVEYADSVDLLKYKGVVKAIVLSAVFEHFVDHDSFLQNVYNALDDDGIFVSLQPTATFARLFGDLPRLGLRFFPLLPYFSVFEVPWHTSLFSIKGMTELVERNGFEILEIRKAPQGSIPGVWGLVQSMLGLVNVFGWILFKTHWPLVIAHTFVLRKRRSY